MNILIDKIKRIKKDMKQRNCAHEWVRVGLEKYVGDTSDWSLDIVPEFQQKYKCGKIECKRYIYYGNFKNKDGSYKFK